MKVSIVSVSRRAGLPCESLVFRNGSCQVSGLRPLGSNSTSSGRSSGSASSGRASMAPSARCSTGMGQPQ